MWESLVVSTAVNMILEADDFRSVQMEMNALKDMVLGKPAPLVSTFRLSYYSILNLMSRAEGQFTAEHVIKNSFHQFQYEKVLLHSNV